MGVNGWTVADSDMHVMEPADLWERYLAPEGRHAAPIGLAELHRDHGYEPTFGPTPSS